MVSNQEIQQAFPDQVQVSSETVAQSTLGLAVVKGTTSGAPNVDVNLCHTWKGC